MSFQKLGIGTRNPNKTLDVSGAVHISETVDISGGMNVATDIRVNDITIGRGSGNNTSTNTVIGYDALASNTSGINNTSTGYNALLTNTSGNRNTANGYEALKGTNGSWNTAVGYSSLNVLSNGWSNVAIGHQAGLDAVNSNKNVFVGVNTGFNNIDATYQDSVTIGVSSQITASNQIMLGRSSETVEIPGDLNVTGTVNGITKAMVGLTNVDDTADTAKPVSTAQQTALNLKANIESPTFTTDISVNSMTIGKGSGNVALNTVVGYKALSSNTTGNFNTASGVYTLNKVTSGSSHTAYGAYAGSGNITNSSTTAIGAFTLTTNTAGGNTAIGAQALRVNTTGGNNVGVGANSLKSQTTGSNNTALGSNTLTLSTIAGNNTAIGTQTLNVSTGSNNTAVGTSSLFNNTTGYSNSANGYFALLNNTIGFYNTATGLSAGNNNTTGSYNTFLGSDTDISPTNATWEKSTALGYNAKITASNQIMLGTSTETVEFPGNIKQQGQQVYSQRLWEVDLTGLNNTYFYPVIFTELPSSSPINFKITGLNTHAASDLYNDNTITGSIRTGGWTDKQVFFDVHQKVYSTSERRFIGIYSGTQDEKTFGVYMRGGYGYSILTDSPNVTLYNTGYTDTINSVSYQLKNSAGTDIGTASSNILRRVDLTTGYADQRYTSGSIDATSYNASSDYRIKENIVNISDTSYNINKLRPVTYKNTKSNNQDFGVIAHELQEQIPFLVTGKKDGETHQSVNYNGLIGLLIHEVQQLKKRNSYTADQNAILQNQLDNIMTILNNNNLS